MAEDPITELRDAIRRLCDTFSDAECALIQQPGRLWRALGGMEACVLWCSDEDLADHAWLFARFLGAPQEFRYHVGCREILAEVLCRLEALQHATIGKTS